MKVSKNILCLDVGFRNTGFAVWCVRRQAFTRSVILSFPPSQDRYVSIELARVSRLLAMRLRTIIGETKPVLVLAELPIGAARNARAATLMAIASATVVATCALLGVKLQAIRPSEIKQWVGGTGRKAVPKAQVIAKVRSIFGDGLLPKSAKCEHVADAMACIGVAKQKGYL